MDANISAHHVEVRLAGFAYFIGRLKKSTYVYVLREGFPVPDRAGAIGIYRYDGKVELLTTRRHSLSDLADLVQASSTTAEKSRYVRYNYSRCLSTPLHREIMFM